jgi:hypothetical protein
MDLLLTGFGQYRYCMALYTISCVWFCTGKDVTEFIEKIPRITVQQEQYLAGATNNYKYKPEWEWRRTWNDKQDCTFEYR